MKHFLILSIFFFLMAGCSKHFVSMNIKNVFAEETSDPKALKVTAKFEKKTVLWPDGSSLPSTAYIKANRNNFSISSALKGNYINGNDYLLGEDVKTSVNERNGYGYVTFYAKINDLNQTNKRVWYLLQPILYSLYLDGNYIK